MGWLRAQAEQMAGRSRPDRDLRGFRRCECRPWHRAAPARHRPAAARARGAACETYLGHCDTPSHRAFGDGAFGLTSAAMDYFWLNYTGVDNDQRHPHAVPIKADLSGLPPVS